jgi:hypothetical protein
MQRSSGRFLKQQGEAIPPLWLFQVSPHPSSRWHTSSMRKIFIEAVTVLSNAFQRLEGQVPPPKLVPHGNGHVYRFIEQNLEQALLLKLARVVTGLKAVDILLAAGLLQEMAALCRILDELCEDISFLAAARTNDEITDLHARYLLGFWAEEFPDPTNTLARHQKPDAPRRNKVVAYTLRTLNPTIDTSTISDAQNTISSTYSGYIHAAASQVMDMYGGNPPHFHIEGMLQTPLMADHVHDGWNYHYRAIAAAIFVARAFGDGELSKALGEYHDKFVVQSGSRGEGIALIAGREPPIREQ